MTLPANVTVMIDRHGKPRYRFRKAGLPQRYLPDPAHHTFQSAYEAALDGQRPPVRKPKARISSKPRRKFRSEMVQDLSCLKGRSIVYFIGAQTGPVKIGTTTNLRGRFKTLQISSSKKLAVLAFVEGDRTIEAQYHARFKEHHHRGEWYLGDAVREEVERLVRAGSCPTYVRKVVANL